MEDDDELADGDPQGGRTCDYEGAADYLGIDEKFLRNQVKLRTGPACVMPSPKRVYFTQEALDPWRAGWKHIEGAQS